MKTARSAPLRHSNPADRFSLTHRVRSHTIPDCSRGLPTAALLMTLCLTACGLNDGSDASGETAARSGKATTKQLVDPSGNTQTSDAASSAMAASGQGVTENDRVVARSAILPSAAGDLAGDSQIPFPAASPRKPQPRRRQPPTTRPATMRKPAVTCPLRRLQPHQPSIQASILHPPRGPIFRVPAHSAPRS